MTLVRQGLWRHSHTRVLTHCLKLVWIATNRTLYILFLAYFVQKQECYTEQKTRYVNRPVKDTRNILKFIS
jgi:hypothetical protein